MKISITDRLRFLRALRSRPFMLLWTGQALSSLGNGAHFVALAWQVLLLTGSGTAIGFVLIASVMPSLLFLLIGGVAADRFPRRLVLLWSDSGRALIVLMIAVLGWLHLLHLWHLIVMELFFGLVNGFFTPAYQAIAPQLIPVDDLTSANALNNLNRELGFLLGPLLGAVLIALSGPANAFAFDGLTFTISMFCLLRMRFHIQPQSPKKDSTLEVPGVKTSVKLLNGFKGFYTDAQEGVKYVVTSTWLWVTISVSGFANMGLTGSIQVALPKLVYNTYHSGAWLLGALSAATAVGSISGALVIGQVNRVFHRGILAYLTLLTASAGLLLFGFPWPHLGGLIIINGAGALVGFSLGAFGVLWATLMQELVPDEKLGRVSSVDWLGSLGLTPVGYALAGFLTDTLGPRWVFLSSGILLATLVFMALCVRDIRQVR